MLIFPFKHGTIKSWLLRLYFGILWEELVSETNDKNSKGKKVDCEVWEKLEKYKILYQAYADEIKNLWQRSIFLGAFMTLAWGGYGALQLKVFDESFKFDLKYSLMSIGLCAVIIVLSLLWIAMAKGSKFVQEAHEWHILENFKFDETEKDIKKLFCKLDDYEYSNFDTSQDIQNWCMNSNLSTDLLLWDTLKAYRYSPSKINVALGWFSFIASFVLLNFHLLLDKVKDNIKFLLSFIQSQECYCVVTLSLLCVLVIHFIIFFMLKGNRHLSYVIKCLKNKILSLYEKTQNKISKKGGKQMAILFFCQHCGEMQDCDLNDIKKYDEKKIEDFARTECKFSLTKTHILSAVVLPDEPNKPDEKD